MTDNANGDLPRLWVGEVENAVIADADAPAVAVFQFLAAARERIVFQGKNGLGNPRLHLRREAGEFFLGVARYFNAPAHARIFNALSAPRNDSRGWRRRASKA